MKIKQLIKKLQKLPEDAVVVLSADGEGNSYSELYDIDYDEETYWLKGEFYYNSELSKTDFKKAKVAAVLYPG